MNINKRSTVHIKINELFLLGLPGILFIIVFSYLPMFGIIIAFKDLRFDLGFFKSKWVGFDNFRFLFLSQDAFRITRNTVVLNLIFIFTLLFISVVFALMLNELTRKSIKVYQTIMFFPYFLSWVVVSFIFLAFFDYQMGWFNRILEAAGVEPVMWYSEAKYWPFILLFANIWKNAGYYAIIYYTGVIGINSEYYEAAEIDGASKLQQVTRITLPLLIPLIIIMVLLQIGRIFHSDFGMFYQLTRDSTALYPTTDVIDTYVYRALRKMGDTGMASAAGLYQSVVGFILVLVSNLVVKKIDKDYSLF